MYRIGGLMLDEKPCDCNAPFAETGIDSDGTVKVILWKIEPNNTQAFCLFSDEYVEMDSLEMICTRCGKSVLR